MPRYDSKLKKTTADDKKMNEIIIALEKLADSEFVFNSNIFADDLRNIVNRLKDNSFKLAVVGEFSSGKSTFLNALIGKDILKHGTMETTATITEIQNTPEIIDGEVFDVYYENGEISENIPIDQLQEYTATSSKLHQVADEIQKVVIKSNLFETRENVCFVDTPGLNGVADNHREKTIEQIKNSHACIYLMQVRGFGQSDIEFIKFISKYQRNIIFVQNFIDEIRNLEGETVEEKLSEQKRILDESIFCDNDNVTYELVGISARKALIARDCMIESYENESLNDNVRRRLFEESRFVSVLSSVTGLMSKNVKDSVQKRETVRVALELLKQLLDMLIYQKRQEDEIWDNSVAGRRKKNLERIRTELQKHRKEYKRNIENYVEAESSGIRRQVNRNIDIQIEEIQDRIRNELEPIIEINGFKKYVKELSQNLYEVITKLENKSNKLMNINFENLLCNAVLRIQQYTGNEAKSSNMGQFEADESHIESTDFSFEQDENEILKLEDELANKKVCLENDRKTRAHIEANIRKSNNEIKAADERIRSIEQQKAAAVARLGSKPVAETKYYTDTCEEYRGGLGIMDFLFGPKIRKIQVPYEDYSEQKKWMKKKSDIENTYKSQQDRIKAESRILMNQMKNYQDDIKHLDKLEPQKQKEIQQIKSMLDAKIENIEVKRKKAQKEYLRNMKNALLLNTHDYLYDDVRNCIFDNFEKSIDINKKKILELTDKFFDLSFDARIRILSEQAEKGENEKIKEKTKQNVKIVSDTIHILEEYL